MDKYLKLTFGVLLILLLLANVFVFPDKILAQKSVQQIVTELNEKEALVLDLQKQRLDAIKDAENFYQNAARKKIPVSNAFEEAIDRLSGQISKLKNETRLLKRYLIGAKISNLARSKSLEELKLLEQQAINSYESTLVENGITPGQYFFVSVDNQTMPGKALSNAAIEEINDALFKAIDFGNAVILRERGVKSGLLAKLKNWWGRGKSGKSGNIPGALSVAIQVGQIVPAIASPTIIKGLFLRREELWDIRDKRSLKEAEKQELEALQEKINNLRKFIDDEELVYLYQQALKETKTAQQRTKDEQERQADIRLFRTEVY